MEKSFKIPIFYGSELTIDGNYSSETWVVFNEMNLLSRITENITKDVDRMNFSLTCKYFYNYMFGTRQRRKYMPGSRFHLNISLLRDMNIPESCPYYGKEETKNVIQFDTSGGCTYVWNYNHIVYERCSKDYGSVNLVPYFSELNRWVTLHSQLITDVRIDYDIGVKSLFYREILYIILEKLVNLKKISMNANIFFVLATFYFEDLQTLTKDKKNIVLEIKASPDDNGGITRRFQKLNEWLTPEHHVELIPKISWSYFHSNFKCPIVSISTYKYFKKIQNISTYDLYMFYSDQQALDEIFVYCDPRSWFKHYDRTGSCGAFKNVSKFTFCCNEQNKSHFGCGLGVLSFFPLDNNGNTNLNLRELSFSMDTYRKFKLSENDVHTISKIFPNITLLTLPASGISNNLGCIFNKFHHLQDIMIWNTTVEQLDQFINFASNFSKDNYLIRTFYFVFKDRGYYLNIENATKIKRKFKYFEADCEPVIISDGQFVLDNVNEFVLLRKKSYKEYKYVDTEIRMSNSVDVLEKFKNIISPKFYE
uniref:F-box domain-containing protein n=1 Tax=Strongyloides papillosus TaxID=174720 RepID=A0A0N5CBT8_STREA